MIQKIKLATLSILVAVLLLVAACPNGSDPFFIAKTTVTGTRATVSLVDFAFAKANQLKMEKCTEDICIKVDPDKGIKYKACMIEDPSTKTEYQACYKGMKNALVIWGKAKDITLVTADAVARAIQLLERIEAAKKSKDPKELEAACKEVDPTQGVEYQKCLKGEKLSLTDWLVIIKSGLCIAAKALKFMPVEYDTYVKPIIALFESYGCSNKITLTRDEAKNLIASIRKHFGTA